MNKEKICSKTLHIREKRDPARRKYRRLLIFSRLAAVLAVLVVVGALAAFWTFAIEPDILTITRLTVVDPDLPENWDGRTIAYFSDAHVGESFDSRRLSRVTEAVNRLAPDLILFGGDMIDHRTPDDDAFISSISDCLARMQAPLGKYAIRGNHDNRLRAELKIAEKILQGGGFQMLVNQSVDLDGILLGGLDESYFGQPDLTAVFPAASPSNAKWRLLLMHQPDFAAELPADSADLILSGHSHNGQVTLFGKPISTVYQGEIYTYGPYSLPDGRQLIVSRGLGTIGMAARFCSPPELMLITLSRH